MGCPASSWFFVAWMASAIWPSIDAARKHGFFSNLRIHPAEDDPLPDWHFRILYRIRKCEVGSVGKQFQGSWLLGYPPEESRRYVANCPLIARQSAYMAAKHPQMAGLWQGRRLTDGACVLLKSLWVKHPPWWLPGDHLAWETAPSDNGSLVSFTKCPELETQQWKKTETSPTSTTWAWMLVSLFTETSMTCNRNFYQYIRWRHSTTWANIIVWLYRYLYITTDILALAYHFSLQPGFFRKLSSPTDGLHFASCSHGVRNKRLTNKRDLLENRNVGQFSGVSRLAIPGFFGTSSLD
jgi:hypothetical protein